MNGLGGYAGWRWYAYPLSSYTLQEPTSYRIFIIEGLATIAIASASFFIIADWPEDAKFLNQKDLIAHCLAADGNSGVARMDRLNKAALKRIFGDWKIWCGYVLSLCTTHVKSN